MINFRFLKEQGPPVLALLVGVTFSVVAFAAVHAHYRNKAEGAFMTRASNHANVIVSGFRQALFAIEFVGALFNSSTSIPWTQFERFVTP